MKTTLLVCFSFFMFSAFAQTLVFEDNFDMYTVGLGVAAQGSGWSTWTGSSSLDATVSNDIPAYSGSKCAKIQGTNVDLVLPVGPFTSGKIDVKWMMYIPTGAGAYFNAMHQWANNSSTYQWACQIYFQNNGTATWTAGGGPGGPLILPQSTWMKMQITADMDNNVGYLYLNGNMVQQWVWSLDDSNGSSGLNKISAVDFFGAGGMIGDEQGLYYIDNVQVFQSTGVGVEEAEVRTNPSVFPNPTTGEIHMQIDSRWTGGIFTVCDLLGREVYAGKISDVPYRTLDLSGLKQGVYLIRWEKAGDVYTSRLVLEK